VCELILNDLSRVYSVLHVVFVDTFVKCLFGQDEELGRHPRTPNFKTANAVSASIHKHQ